MPDVGTRPPLPDLPRIYADFNGLVSRDPLLVVLDTPGTFRDLASHGLEPRDGLRVLLYDPDADESGPNDILCVAVMTRSERWGWVGVLESDHVTWESDWAPTAT